jgi:AraC-like DNA-binding protein
MTGIYTFTTPVQEKYGGYPIVEGLKKVMSEDSSSENDFILPQYLGEGKLRRLMSNDSCDIYAYLLDKRMEYAWLLLEKRAFHVYEVAEMTGYSDSSSFSKVFFKRYGYRPVECIK